MSIGCATPPTPDADAREDALRRAHVWMEPSVRIEDARFDENPSGEDGFAVDASVDCRFKPGGVSGTSPKFECQLDGGRTIKVKYGRTNPEVYAEVAASRLLAALGFPTDRMYVVKRVRCFGCPPDPFINLECMNDEGATLEGCFPHVDFTRHEDFDPAVIERPVKGRHVTAKNVRGWGWEELTKIQASAGGARRAEVDALRLMAVFLGHWDNKPGNQRLLCLGAADDAAGCHPVAMIQDLGATFGPAKLDLEHWAAVPIWADVATCGVSMKALPYGGSTFPDTRLSEDGRQFLAARLKRLTTAQIGALFDGARIGAYRHRTAPPIERAAWVRVFAEKVRAIVDRVPCPPAL
jgi:hypothetical protein